jgi:hypothetical protein
VCFIATRGTLQHVSAYMGHHQVIFYNTGIPSFCLKTSAYNGSVGFEYHWAVSNGYGYIH